MTFQRSFALVLVAGLLVACSDGRPTASSNVNPTGQDGGPGGRGLADGGDAGPDASVITPRPDLCEGLSLDTDRVPEIEYYDDPPPALGGEVQAGTYELTELAVYAGEDARPEPDGGADPPTARFTGRAAKGTMILTEFEMRIIEALGQDSEGGLGPPESRASLYRVDGANILATSVCPTTALPAPIPFSAVGDTLALFPDPKTRMLYRLRP